MALIQRQKLFQSKIRYPGVVIIIKKYVLRLNITMDDLGAALLMKIQETSSDSNGNFGPQFPIRLLVSKEETSQGAIAHELIH